MQNMFWRNPCALACLTALLCGLGCAPPPITWNQAGVPRPAAAAEKPPGAAAAKPVPLPTRSTP